ncbi:MAG: MmgE/PrpD family protein [Deltaproteobacteria bacterium]|nr:MAG: MmgE/PrpD family protein [Deltaproteobacteria bacterium]
MQVTKDIADFAVKTNYEDLPPYAVRETKRLLLDTMGCAIGGLSTQKGKIAIDLARLLKGPAEATILGTGDKVSGASSAFAAGELINALDYEALLSPPDHATPYVLPAPLAIGEMKRVSGKELIIATAVAHELATRIGSSLIFGRRFAVELPERGAVMSLPTPGYGLCSFAGAAAGGRLLGLSADQIAHAMGIAGYVAPVPMLTKFATTVPVSLGKYLSAGFLSQAQVLAILSAHMGYTGDTQVLDSDYGFWRAFGCDGWKPEYITQGLGQVWHFPERIFYKTFPCCGAMQNTLAHFHSIITQNDLDHQDITEVIVKLNLLAELPVWRTTQIETHVGLQFSVSYIFSIAAHRIEIGPSWQMPEIFTHQGIAEFTSKVKVITDLDDEAHQRPDVEVVTGTGPARKTYSKKGIALGHQMTDTELVDKFKRNTHSILNQDQIQEAITLIQTLEDCNDITQLFACISPAKPG